MLDLDDVLSLAEAAAELGVSPGTLRTQVRRDRLRARRVGGTWITTREEVLRYRTEDLGRHGRPRSGAVVLRTLPWPRHRTPDGDLRIVGYEDTTAADTLAIAQVAREQIAAGVDSAFDLVAVLRSDPRTRHVTLSSGERPPWIGLGRVVLHADSPLLEDGARRSGSSLQPSGATVPGR